MKDIKPKIGLVVVWFGPLPFWMPAFLLSCKYNPGVEWVIFSDAAVPLNLPDNVRFLPLTIEEFNCRATEALGFKVAITASFTYKMCDLKIMYGRVFEEELRNYDFWGCCDMDIVWGDIRQFITPEILMRYDVITSRIGRISGHFCLFRNQRRWNELFRRITDVVARVGDKDKYRRIDEDGLTDLLQGYRKSSFRRMWVGYVRRLPLPRVYWDQVLTTSGKHQRQMLADSSLQLRWRDGKAYGVHGEEMMYLHFHTIRKSMNEMDFSLDGSPSEFMVTTKGLFAETRKFGE